MARARIKFQNASNEVRDSISEDGNCTANSSSITAKSVTIARESQPWTDSELASKISRRDNVGNTVEKHLSNCSWASFMYGPLTFSVAKKTEHFD
jgi:hypothetical protein